VPINGLFFDRSGLCGKLTDFKIYGSVRDCDAVTFTGFFGVKIRSLVLADRNSPLAGDSFFL
jgi:hypothetical protein